ncbi:ROK family protein [Paenibacillus marinisediminis]
MEHQGLTPDPSHNLNLNSDSGRMITIAIDAGGTYLKAALLENRQLLAAPRLTQPSYSDLSSHEIILGFADVSELLLNEYCAVSAPLDTSLDEVRIGFAFPGPFDYPEGIALLQGMGKYDSLYGMRVGDLLKQELARRASLPQAKPWAPLLAEASIVFENDATAFALGVSLQYPAERLICLTLGTGLGSSFIDCGTIIAGQRGVPQNGMLYAEPYRGAPADDQFGRRGILAMAAAHGLRPGELDVRGLAIAAQSGDTNAVALFRDYGQRLGDFLKPYAAAFQPARILLGGQIAKSFDLWAADMRAAIGMEALSISPILDEMEQVYLGIDQLY